MLYPDENLLIYGLPQRFASESKASVATSLCSFLTKRPQETKCYQRPQQQGWSAKQAEASISQDHLMYLNRIDQGTGLNERLFLARFNVVFVCIRRVCFSAFRWIHAANALPNEQRAYSILSNNLSEDTHSYSDSVHLCCKKLRGSWARLMLRLVPVEPATQRATSLRTATQFPH